MSAEHVDVLVVGAGLSGIGAACRLQERCPGKTYTILEARGALGGTWDQFRFPGIRSDSDMFTLSYPFRPWTGTQAIVDGPAILDYLRATAREHGIERHVRFHHRVVAAAWSSSDARWTVTVARGDTGETMALTCGFLFTCTGYFRYDAGYTPAFPGVERFRGTLAHPQDWTEDIDYADRRVVVIGSGATAVTLVPVIARRARHVTMLQRSPSYIISLPTVDPLAALLRRVLPPRLAARAVRAKNARVALAVYGLCRRRPRLMRRVLRSLAARRLPAGYDLDTHFNPRYDPWDQRLCVIPDNDLFDAISAGRVAVVTDRVASFTETGVALASGAELEADLVITATGLQMEPLGGLRLSVDGRDVDLAATFAYRGMQLSDVPNMAFAFGYTNQSWTLGSDLTCERVCRLLRHMDAHGHAVCIPRVRDPALTGAPIADLTSSYIMRSIDRFPQQGSHDPWRREQHYVRNRRDLRRAPIDEPALDFAGPSPPRG